MSNISEYNYETIDIPYNNYLNRSPGGIVGAGLEDASGEKIANDLSGKILTDASSGKTIVNSPTDIAGKAINGQSFDNMWIGSWIKSTNYLPKTRGFMIDGINGYIECMKLYVGTGGIIGGKIDIPDTTSANSWHVDTSGNMWAGSTTFSSAPFRISTEGVIFAKRLTLENFVNDDDSSITYTGTWSQETVGTLYGRTRTISNTVGDYFEISFSGTSIGLIAEKAANVGKLKIYIDGVYIETVDLYSSTLSSRSVIWQKIDLSNTNHTLKGEIETKNTSAIDNKIGLQGYTLFPHEGIKLEQLSCDLYAYSTSKITDANGYVKLAISSPSGYSVYCIVGMKLSESVMSDATSGDPKFAWRGTELYLYNGAINTTYSITVTLLISKI